MTAATYDGNGLRATTTITPPAGTAVTQNYVWDVLPRVPQLDHGRHQRLHLRRHYAPAEQVSLSTGAITYLVTDSLGSVRGTVSTSGALTGTTSYDAWGNPQTRGGLTATPFGYAGGYTDPDGLIYLLNRYYDPATGQFISVDPAISHSAALRLRRRQPGLPHRPHRDCAKGAPDSPPVACTGHVVHTNPGGGGGGHSEHPPAESWPEGYNYLYEEMVDPIKVSGSPARVMRLFQRDPKLVFPFPITGCSSLMPARIARCTVADNRTWSRRSQGGNLLGCLPLHGCVNRILRCPRLLHHLRIEPEEREPLLVAARSRRSHRHIRGDRSIPGNCGGYMG